MNRKVTSYFIKRIIDILGAGISLILLSPIFAAIAVLIKLDSPGPILYRQKRVGLNGKLFTFYKLRSMYNDVSEDKHRNYLKKLIKGEAAPFSLNDDPIYKITDDGRITSLGKWLRRFGIDELIQIINVLKGEMSLVGPRPAIPYEVEEYEEWHKKRLNVKPGITGLWIVSGWTSVAFEKMVKLDIYYIEHWSVCLDFKILLKTIPVVLSGKSAH